MKLNNTYYLLRHGQALSNIDRFCSCYPEKIHNPLTQKGQQMAQKAAEELEDKGMTHIFASDLLRTQETAEIVAKKLNLEVKTDIRLRELNFGIFNGKPLEFFDTYFREESERLEKPAPEGETYQDVANRVTSFITEIDATVQGTVLIVSHECPLWILRDVVKDISLKDDLSGKSFQEKIPNGTIIKLN